MDAMFVGANAFNGDISLLDASPVLTMNYVFKDAEAFNRDIVPWNISGVFNVAIEHSPHSIYFRHTS